MVFVLLGKKLIFQILKLNEFSFPFLKFLLCAYNVFALKVCMIYLGCTGHVLLGCKPAEEQQQRHELCDFKHCRGKTI